MGLLQPHSCALRAWADRCPSLSRDAIDLNTQPVERVISSEDLDHLHGLAYAKILDTESSPELLNEVLDLLDSIKDEREQIGKGEIAP